MRILLASNVYPPNFIGGAELIAHQQAKALQSLGHEVEVFAGEAQAFGAHHAFRKESFDGIPVHRVSMLQMDYEPTFVNFSHRDIEAQFEEVVERFRPDVFHGHNLIGLSATLPHLARRAGAAAVLTLHDHWGYCFKNTIIKSGTRICEDFSRCAECMATIDDGTARAIPIRFRKDFIALMLSEIDAFVSPSRYLAQSYVKAGFPPQRMHVVWNGMDVSRFQKIARIPSEGELRLTYVGILAPHKGVLTLLESRANLPDKYRVRVNLVGSGELHAACEDLLRRSGRSHWVRFWGHVDNARIEEVYAQTDVLVLPSVWPENQPVSITEAMSCSIPAIVSNMGGMLELVEDGVSGDVFEVGDPEDLASSILRYLQDPSRAHRMGRAARLRIESHSFERQVQKLVDIYREARKTPRGSPVISRLAMCVGNRVSAETAQAAEVLGNEDGWSFVMREWLPPTWVARSRVTWVCGPQAPCEQTDGFAYGTPAVVDIRNRETRRRAWESGSTLFFHDAEQAVRAARVLERNDEVRAEMERRARQPAIES
jgi:glycosyltransferase involved in cell wall biosynthesis